MSALILDAGALIAVDRGDPVVLAQIEEAGKTGDPVRTKAMTIAQVWRDGKGRQARLARVLRGVEIEPIVREDGLRAGELLGVTRLKTRLTPAWRCSLDRVTGCLPVIVTTCGHSVMPRETRPWWPAADCGDGVRLLA